MEKIFGFKPTEFDGTEHVFESDVITLPKKYSYKKYLPGVYDQGSDSICVPCSISAYLNWRTNLTDGSKKDNKINYFQIYNSKTTEGDGMTFKEALHFLRHNGVKSKAGVLKIDNYSIIKSGFFLKTAIVTNGPCVGALPVYNNEDEFWIKRSGDVLLGYHAISICGYDEGGYIIRNSWGRGFADNGYTYLKEEDINRFVEIWTIV